MCAHVFLCVRNRMLVLVSRRITKIKKKERKKKRTTTTRINVPGNALGAKQPCAMVQSGGRVAGKLPCGKRPGGIG